MTSLESRPTMARRISGVIRNLDFKDCDPEMSVAFLKLPSMRTYAALNKKLRSCDQTWMNGFLEASGLNALLEAVDSLSSKKLCQLTDAMMLLECVSCVREVMNSKMGLEFLLDPQHHLVPKLVRALDNPNVVVKKQLYELLSAVCVYSEDGAKLLLDAFSGLKTKRQRQRFIPILTDLRDPDSAPAFVAAVLGLVNCIVLACDDLKERMHLRAEFIALGITEILDKLHDGCPPEDIAVQCDLFLDEKRTDEESLAELSPQGLDINCHQDVFAVILDKVRSESNDTLLLSILQSFLQVQGEQSAIIWELIDKLVSKAILINNEEEADLLLNPHKSVDLRQLLAKGTGSQTTCGLVDDGSVYCNINCDCKRSTKSEQRQSEAMCSICRNLQTSGPGGIPPPSSSIPAPPPPPPPPGDIPPPPPPPGGIPPPPPPPGGIPPPPPPPPPPGGIPPPPPPPGGIPSPPPLPGGIPPPLPLLGGIPPPPLPPGGIPPPPPPPGGIPPPPPSPGGIPPPPPPPGGIPPPLGGTPPPPPPPGGAPPPPPGAPIPCNSGGFNAHLSKSLSVPIPKTKMKTLNWTKIPNNALSRSKSVWSEIHTLNDPVEVDYSVMETLFCRNTVASKDKKKENQKEGPSEINLLDMKRSMNVNIFLKQFKMSNEAVVEALRCGDMSKIESETLRGLLNILPEADEVELIRNFDGDETKLGNAEKFFSKLISLPSFRMRIEGLLLRSEFKVRFDTIDPEIQVIIRVCEDLLSEPSLREFLKIVLVMGNFMNNSSYAGNASGFKMASLLKLSETRANKPRMTFLHFLVEVVRESGKDVLKFSDELLKPLTVASKLSLDGISTDVKQLNKSLVGLKGQLSSSDDEGLKEQFSEFIGSAQKDMQTLTDGLVEIDALAAKVASHFCEDPEKFKLEEHLKIFCTFCERVQTCLKENQLRKEQEEKAERRRKEKEEAAAKKLREHEQLPSSPEVDEESMIVDTILKDIRSGRGHRTRRSQRRTSSVPAPLGRERGPMDQLAAVLCS